MCCLGVGRSAIRIFGGLGDERTTGTCCYLLRGATTEVLFSGPPQTNFQPSRSAVEGDNQKPISSPAGGFQCSGKG